MNTGDRIRRLREKKDWSQKKLAEKVGINTSVFNRIEANTRKARADELAKIADALDVSVDYLSGKTGDPYPQVYKAPTNITNAFIKEVVEKYKINLDNEEDRVRFEKLVDLFYGEQNRNK